MTLKKKLGMGIASAVLGAALVGGGTFAFFSDKRSVKQYICGWYA
ncbi:TasA family protein [Bacillus cereus]